MMYSFVHVHAFWRLAENRHMTRLASNSGFGPTPPWFRVTETKCRCGFVYCYGPPPLITLLHGLVCFIFLSTSHCCGLHSVHYHHSDRTNILRFGLAIKALFVPASSSFISLARFTTFSSLSPARCASNHAGNSGQPFSTLTRPTPRQATDRANAPSLVSHPNTRTLATSANARSMALSNFSGVMNG